ncbi:glutamate racemase [Garciella nitratireducens]|uniref:glutamate racemase n=1 Tax=Garciella nitratireducens TaxID=218205 RepID=UPI000DE98002|nr:glutamate racemase [Garciella nitratireducens]RBP44932.1 glutamate racemase [Garciella nitratireducens]
MQSNNNPIGVIDSGVGGLTVIREIQKQLPKENILYFGDSKNMPYGNKEPEEIISLTKKMFSFMELQNVKVILLACNTISSFIEELIPLTEIPVFDIVYPGCLAAIENNPKEGIGLIATEATVKSNIYKKTLESLKPEFCLYSNGSRDLAKVIEKNNGDQSQLNFTIKSAIDPILKKASIDNLILGCTHYPIVSKNISKLYPQLKLIDPAKKLVEIVKHFLEKNHLLASNSNTKLNIYTSGSMENFLPFIDQLEIKNYNIMVKELD